MRQERLLGKHLARAICFPACHMTWHLTMCRPGFYCPSPELQLPCPPGSWCAQATVEPTTCEYPVLMTELPDLTISDVPLTVVQRVYGKGDPLGGNICPPVSRLLSLCLDLYACTSGQNSAFLLSCTVVQNRPA